MKFIFIAQIKKGGMRSGLGCLLCSDELLYRHIERSNFLKFILWLVLHSIEFQREVKTVLFPLHPHPHISVPFPFIKPFYRLFHLPTLMHNSFIL